MPLHCRYIAVTLPSQRTQLLALVKITFEQRRKMLRQSLKRYLPNAATLPSDELLSLRPEQLVSYTP